MARMENQIYVMGDYIDAYTCDRCGEEEVGEYKHHEEKDFTLCFGCIIEMHSELINNMYGDRNQPNSRMNKKENISDSIRWDVYGRDNFSCRYCGERKNLTLDHVYPESLGGEATLDNLVTACKSCNSRKGARTPEGANMKLRSIG